jgi:hypothetical protein
VRCPNSCHHAPTTPPLPGPLDPCGTEGGLTKVPQGLYGPTLPGCLPPPYLDEVARCHVSGSPKSILSKSSPARSSLRVTAAGGTSVGSPPAGGGSARVGVLDVHPTAAPKRVSFAEAALKGAADGGDMGGAFVNMSPHPARGQRSR